MTPEFFRMKLYTNLSLMFSSSPSGLELTTYKRSAMGVPKKVQKMPTMVVRTNTF
jgi:hypothetical protein